MSKQSKEVVTVGMCKLITDATNAKIDAQSVLYNTKLDEVKVMIRNGQTTTRMMNAITLTSIGLLLAALEIILRNLH